MGKRSVEHDLVTYLSGIKVYSTMGGVQVRQAQALFRKMKKGSVKRNAQMFNSTGIAPVGNSGTLDIGSGFSAYS